MKKISIIIPAYNEEQNILLTIENVIFSFKKFKIEGEIIVIDDGSTDRTFQLVQNKQKELPNLRLVRNDTNKGIGFTFWKGVEVAKGDTVTMIPGDNENDSGEILRYYWLMEHVDFVVPFIYNKEVRPYFRRFLSSLYNFIIRTSFSLNLNYTNGTILCRRSVLRTLEHESKGFFFQTDILVRVIKKGYLFAEVPQQLNKRSSGKSKAIKFSSLVNLTTEYFHLLRDYYFNRNLFFKKNWVPDSMTFIRQNATN